MARFHFSLEKILHWRSLELAAEGAKLAKLTSEQFRLQALRAELNVERARLDASPATLPDLRGADLRVMAPYRLRLLRETGNLSSQLSQCGQQIREQEKRYRLAKQRVRLLEELKARKLADWRHDQDAQLETLAGSSYLAMWNRPRF